MNRNELVMHQGAREQRHAVIADSNTGGGAGIRFSHLSTLASGLTGKEQALKAIFRWFACAVMVNVRYEAQLSVGVAESWAERGDNQEHRLQSCENSIRELLVHRLRESNRSIGIALAEFGVDAVIVVVAFDQRRAAIAEAQYVSGAILRLALNESELTPNQLTEFAEFFKSVDSRASVAPLLAALKVKDYGRNANVVSALPLRIQRGDEPDSRPQLRLICSDSLDNGVVETLSFLGQRYQRTINELLEICWWNFIVRLLGDESHRAVVYRTFPGDWRESLAGEYKCSTDLQCNLNESLSDAVDRFAALAWSDLPSEHLAEVRHAIAWQRETEVSRVWGDLRLGDNARIFGYQLIPEVGMCASGNIRAGRVVISLAYPVDQYEEEYPTQLLKQFLEFIGLVSLNPDGAMSQVRFAPNTHYLRCAQQSSTALSDTCTIVHHALTKRDNRSAHALIDSLSSMSYDEMYAAVSIARSTLQQSGVGKGGRVALIIDRSSAFIVTSLAVMSLGASYTPIDPRWPRQRVSQMLSILRPNVVVVGADDSLANVDPGLSTTIIPYDSLLRDTNSAHSICIDAAMDDVAYIIFTSGSTGIPKGVAITHRQLITYVESVVGLVSLHGCSTVGLLSSVAADLGNTAIFGALYLGKRLAIADESEATDPMLYKDFVKRFSVDFIKVVPSHLAALLSDHADRESIPRTLVFGGERLSAEFVAKIWRARGDCHIFNHYGPTEATIGVLLHPVDKTRLRSAGVELSQPIGDSEVLILDGANGIAPIGAVGEIAVRGKQVIGEYIDGARRRSLPHPLERGSSMYGTGDRAVYLMDGSIQVLGRVDNQVKVSGYRVSLEEVEATVRQVLGSDVVAVVAVPAEASTNDTELIAYIGSSAAATGSPDIKNVRSMLRERLPNYMVPSHFIFEGALPRLPNGKIDRQQLTARADRIDFDPRAEEAGELTAEILHVISDVLRQDVKDPEANFFDVGGSSLAAIKLITRLRERYGCELSLSTFFERPTAAGLAAMIDVKKPTTDASESIPRKNSDTGRWVASPMQRGLWYLKQADSTKDDYVVYGAVEIRGELDVSALSRSAIRLVERHESLRTTFEKAPDGSPLQVVSDQIPETVLELVEITDGVDSQSVLQKELGYLRVGQMSMAEGPLYRIRLCRLSSTEYVLVLAVHHIICDAWSKEILLSELLELYKCTLERRVPALPDLTTRYVDFSAWADGRVSLPKVKAQQDYWVKKIVGAPRGSLNLPYKTSSELERETNSKTLVFPIAGAFLDKFGGVKRRFRATTFEIALGVVAALIYRISSSGTVKIAVPSAFRADGLQRVVGHLVNTHVYVLTVSGDYTLADIINHSVRSNAEARANSEAWYPDVTRLVRDAVGETGEALCQVKLNCQQSIQQSWQVRGVNFKPLPIARSHTHFELEFDVFEAEDQLSFELSYRSGLITDEAAQGIGLAMERILHAIITSPTMRVSELEWGKDEKAYLQGIPYVGPIETCGSLIKRNLKEKPDVVLRHGDEVLTYSDLLLHAESWAGALRAHGPAIGEKIAILGHRSVEFIAAVLGIWWSGGAYIPIDVGWPRERIREVLRAANISQVLIEPGIDASGLELVFADFPAITRHERATGPGQTSIGSAVDLSNSSQSAYVMFTSGSTGTPKGVEVKHSSLTNYVHHAIEWIAPYPGPLCLTTTLFADLGLTIVLAALAASRELHLLTDEAARDADVFAAYIERHRIAVTKMVPTHLKGLLKANESEFIVPGRLLILGGEASDSALIATVRARRSDCEILNHYGPTETTIGVLTYRVKAGDVGMIPVGRPIPNVDVMVLDSDLSVTMRGVRGELYIGGAAVALGYVRAPASTAARFLPHQLSSEPGNRMYRTGDQVTMAIDGVVSYLGRIDDQLKIRGYRVDPIEVERAVKAAELGDSVVVTREGQFGPKLALYLVPAETYANRQESVRERLLEILPDYMVPAEIILIEAFPVSENGKVDRTRLPAQASSFAEEKPVRPISEAERVLVDIWQEVLGVAMVGIDDNFFELGGDSIVGLQVVSKAKAAGIKLSPLLIFEAQTVRRIAARAERIVDRPNVSPASNDSSETLIPLTPVQAWFYSQPNVDFQHHTQSLTLEVCDASLTPEIIERAISAVIMAHPALHTGYSRRGGKLAGYSCPAIPFRLNKAGPIRKASLDISGVVEKLRLTISLDNGLLAAAELFESEGNPILVLVVHHLAIDTVSWRILIEDIATACKQLRERADVVLEPETVSYEQWARKLRSLVDEEQFDAEAEYWRGQVNGLDNIQVASGKANQRVELLTETYEADTYTSDVVLASGPRLLSSSVNEILMALIVRALSHWLKREDVGIEMEGHGRTSGLAEADLSRTVGWFTALYPLMFKVPHKRDHAGFRDAVECVKTSLRSVPNGGVGYGALKYLRPAALTVKDAYPHITVNFQGNVDHALASTGCFRLFSSPASIDRSRSRSRNWLTITAFVFEKQLRLTFVLDPSRSAASAALSLLINEFSSEINGLVDAIAAEEKRNLRLSNDLGNKAEVPRYSLSPLQAGILYHCLDRPESGRYISGFMVDLVGVNLEQLRRAWRAVVKRHDILRAAIHAASEGLTEAQQFHDSIETDIEIGAKSDLALSIEDHVGATRFDLKVPPLIKIRALPLGTDGEFRLVCTYHHIILDGWSSALLVREILETYAREEISTTPFSYRDYVRWVNDRDLDMARVYWRDVMSQIDSPTLLSENYHVGTGSIADTAYESVVQQWSPEESAEIVLWCRNHHITTNTLVQFAVGLVLSKICRQDTVCFGSTSSGRSPELEGVERGIGLFITTTPIVFCVRPDDSVEGHLIALQRQGASSREHEHLPLYEIQQLSGCRGTSLFDTLVVVENYPRPTSGQNFGGLKVSALESFTSNNYAVTVIMRPGRTISLHVSYDTRILDRDGATQFLAAISEILGARVNTSSSVGALLTSTETLRISAHDAEIKWNDYQSSLESIYTRWSRAVAVHPSKVALRSGEQAITYAELSRRVSQLGDRLYAMGCRPGHVVAICLPTSIDAVVSILAVLSNRAAYLPLDPKQPENRIRKILQDSGAGFAIAGPVNLKDLGVVTCRLDDSVLVTNEDVHRPSTEPLASEIAYCIYTSGSTGVPKGVMVSNANILRLVDMAGHHFELASDENWLLFHPLYFDFSVWELLCPLLLGHSVVLADERVRRDPEALLELLSKERITMLSQTPGAFSVLMNFTNFVQSLDSLALKYVVFGGERLVPSALAGLWKGVRHSTTRFVNMYGITETTVHASYLELLPRHGQYADSRIGRPLADVTLYVLDEHLQPVAPGYTGEVYVGGAGVASGYLRAPRLTAKRFLPDPTRKGKRMYRSGDLGFIDAEGLTYMGRSDLQVKVRGHRVELGEIEAAATQCELVSEVVALAATESGELVVHLFAVLTKRQERDDKCASEILDCVRSRVPHYMVPRFVHIVDHIPLNRNGKRDKLALMELTAKAERVTEENMTEDEQLVGQIWQSVLGADRIGPGIDFFAVGGHSLHVARVTAEVRALYMTDVPMSLLFESPILRDYVARITKVGRSERRDQIAKLRDIFKD